ncbi:unnamed protein product [Phytophthora lilii]|uniref:Unnamed protein product n=1 Tax=Phytophthora lilii TaxID=2077276 RepID=A0A9W6WYX4_9STRA|nr:unnamed protein product [Phytophthora lilii]
MELFPCLVSGRSKKDNLRKSYSPKKNNANPIAEYSTLYPETNSASASGKSNGCRFVSAKHDIKKLKRRGKRGKQYHTVFCAKTIEIKFKDKNKINNNFGCDRKVSREKPEREQSFRGKPRVSTAQDKKPFNKRSFKPGHYAPVEQSKEGHVLLLQKTWSFQARLQEAEERSGKRPTTPVEEGPDVDTVFKPELTGYPWSVNRTPFRCEGSKRGDVSTAVEVITRAEDRDRQVDLTASLFTLLKKKNLRNSKITLNASQLNNFKELMKRLKDTPVLHLPDFTKQMHLRTDASQFAVGGVLFQVVDGAERPIAFTSRKMKSAKLKYPNQQQELLAIVNALAAFQIYCLNPIKKKLNDNMM